MTLEQLRAENQKLREALKEARDYFYDRADMETLPDQGDVGNEEMTLLHVCDAALGNPISQY